MENFVIIAGIATFLNFAIIYYKFMHQRYLSAAIDTGVLVVSAMLFLGSMSGMSIAMIASMLFSLFLFIVPPKTDKSVIW